MVNITDVLSDVASLNSREHTELFRMIRQFGKSYTQNSNGVFIDLSSFEPSELEEFCSTVERMTSDALRVEDCQSMLSCETTINSKGFDSEPVPSSEKFDDENISRDPPIKWVHNSQINNCIESVCTSFAKKCVHNKYSAIKKKYHKQSITDHWKKNDDPNLSELESDIVEKCT